MIRLGRRTSLRVALFLLTSTATAHAECAWVLWMKTSATEWDPAQGFVIRQECIAALRKKFNEVRDETTTNIDDLDGGSFSVDTEDRTKSTAGRCLPDTLDLRGPKGK